LAIVIAVFSKIPAINRAVTATATPEGAAIGAAQPFLADPSLGESVDCLLGLLVAIAAMTAN
jgi:hypothetical protein